MSEDQNENQATVVSAERGILSKRDRKYFRDILGVEPDSAHERVIRQDVRKRLKNAILDFELLIEHLRDDDRNRVMDDLLSISKQNSAVLPNVVAFLYSATADRSDIEFESILKDGVRIGTDHCDHVIKELTFNLETNTVEQEELLQDLESERGISLAEFGHLLRTNSLPDPDPETQSVSFHMDFSDPLEGFEDVQIRLERGH